MAMSSDTASPFGTYALSGWRLIFLHIAQAMPANWFGRRGALVMRKLVLRGGPDIVDAEIEGLRFRLYMRDNVSERKYLFLPQFVDAEERAHLRRTLKEGNVFADIGANAGIYTLWGAQAVGASGRVISVEPNPVVGERLRFNIALNGFEGWVSVVEAGVSDAAGHFDLVLDDSNLGGSSIALQRSDKSIRVRCAPLDIILFEQGQLFAHAIKIDIEGAEDRVLIPFLTSMPEHFLPKLIIVENSVKDWQQDLPDALVKAGYWCVKKTRMNLIYRFGGNTRKA